MTGSRSTWKKLACRRAKPALGAIAGNRIADAFRRSEAKANPGTCRFRVDGASSHLKHESRRNPAPAGSCDR